jgi:site-specific DNA-methyltransferase (adenine-specific)
METNKIYQGDCLELMKQIEDKSIDLILCDLPYGTTACKWDTIIPFEPLWKQYKRVIKDNGVICLFADEPFSSILVTSNLEMYRYELIWKKPQGTDFLNANRKPLKSHEKIQIFYKSQPIYNKQYTYSKPYKAVNGSKDSSVWGKFKFGMNKSSDGERNPISVLEYKQEKGLHPTQKPVKLCEYLIKTYTNEGDLVLDNCIGSGTTAIACIKTNRRFIGMELEQKYVDIANKRIGEVKQEAMQSEARNSSQA